MQPCMPRHLYATMDRKHAWWWQKEKQRLRLIPGKTETILNLCRLKQTILWFIVRYEQET